MESVGDRLLPEWTRLPPLGASEVQVHALRSVGDHGLVARARRLLSAAETERAERIRIAGAREEFVVARAALRVLLGSATGSRPEEVAIATDAFGKPFVPGVHFNVSHSRGLIYVALCRAASVGVDVEWIDSGIEALEIAESNFTSEEAAAIASMRPGVERARSFCRLWTRKEAVGKAQGQGLQTPLRDIHVHGDASGRAWIGSSDLPDMAENRFHLRDLAVPSGFAAALAIRGMALPVTFRAAESLRQADLGVHSQLINN